VLSAKKRLFLAYEIGKESDLIFIRETVCQLPQIELSKNTHQAFRGCCGCAYVNLTTTKLLVQIFLTYNKQREQNRMEMTGSGRVADDEINFKFAL
jgi:hypothetical protein